MKILYLIRHAKAVNNITQLSDIDRPLAERGYSDAYKMAHSLLEEKKIPQAIITSPATRALNTALIFARVLNFKTEKVKLLQELYNTDLLKYLEIISTINDNIPVAFIFGHNNTMHETANYLSTVPIALMPTCSVVALQFNTNSWLEIFNSKGNLILHSYPKIMQD